MNTGETCAHPPEQQSERADREMGAGRRARDFLWDGGSLGIPQRNRVMTDLR